MGLRRVGALMAPDAVVGHEGRPGARLERGKNVGAHRIPGHHRAPRLDAVAVENGAEGRRLLVADDLDARKSVAQAGGGELGLLVEQIALGDEDEPAAFGQRVERRHDAVEQFDGMIQERATGGEDLGNGARWQVLAAELKRGIDHRQSEGLGAIAVEPEVADLAGFEGRAGDLRVCKRAEDVGQRLLRRLEMAHVVPERVVGIEADKFYGHALNPRGCGYARVCRASAHRRSATVRSSP